jgi:hypothetical protein
MPQTPTSMHAAQALLRADPGTAMAKYGFVVGNAVYTTTTIGGVCLLGCESAGGNIYKLTANQGQGDWLFPYINTAGGGVGVCVVPAGQVDGTIVVTGGMNGCSLQVNKSGNDFYFYHDNNGNSMKGKLTPGEVVCRVDYKDYAGPLDIGKKLVDQYPMTAHVRAGYEYYCITVHHGGRWKVFVSALIRITTVSPPTIFRSSVATTVEYKAFIPTVTPLMTSFADE